MGKLSRNKGKAFERKIARAYREAIPEIAEEVRRSDQSHQADDSDVTGLPGLWTECEDAREPNPLKKLEQAERDAKDGRIPVAITHKMRAKSVQATLRLRDLVQLFNENAGDVGMSEDQPVTMDFDDFLVLYRGSQRWRST